MSDNKTEQDYLDAFENDIKSALDNPTLESLATVVSNIIYMVEGALQSNAIQAGISNTLVDILLEQGIIKDDGDFDKRLEKHLLDIQERYAQTAETLEKEIEKQAESDETPE